MDIVLITEKAAGLIDIPEPGACMVLPAEEIEAKIKALPAGADSGPHFVVAFTHADEFSLVRNCLSSPRETPLIYQFVLIGTASDLSGFSSDGLQNISEFRTGRIERADFRFIVAKTMSVLREYFKAVTIRNEHLAMLMDVRRDQESLINIGKALSSEKDPDSLLWLILFLSKKITGADAGSIYLVEEDERGTKRLRFKFSDTFARDIPLEEFVIDIDRGSIAGYVAVTGQVLNIPDAYSLPVGTPYSFNSSFDRQNDYESRSMLVVPMRNHVDEIIGVIQLINSKKNPSSKTISGNEAFEIALKSPDDFRRYVVAFDAKYDSLMQAVAGQAAVAIENNRLIEQIRRQFEEFVKASVTAIESRDPATSGHSFRVARLCREMALAVNEVKDGYLGGYNFTESAVRELELAALLHDFGKVYIDLAIFRKSKKLFPKDFENLKLRFDFLYRCLEIDGLNREIERLRPGPGGNVKTESFAEMLSERDALLNGIRAIKEKIVNMNEPAVTDDDPEELLSAMLADIEALGCRDIEGNALEVVSDRDRTNLSIRKGSLNEDERREIESHVVHTYNFVSRIPWPPEFRNIPEIALRHHEKLDGSGYPDGLAGRESTMLQSRIMAIVDVYDALSATDRPYKKAVPLHETLEILKKDADEGKLDPDLVALFISARIYERAARAG
ncbi:MAG TPA: HD domain-containing phosphohydrolase [Spirochaetota bacterium]|nr:HD domain-containing phosphohydrolase [Spirochaetota bacterium]HRZ26294.1 HD domain-containing phosphohydrolase [Spirochaetota bacterium]